jgi:hypothetical protein
VRQGGGFDTVEKRKIISSPSGGSNCDSSVVQPVTYSLYRLRYPEYFKLIITKLLLTNFTELSPS